MSNSDMNNLAPSDFNQKAAFIQIEDLIKIYKRGKIEVVALRGLNCNLYRGEICVIMGPSGCGKTTLLNMLGALDRVNSGRIFVTEEDITKLNDADLEKFRRDKIGFVFQFLNLIPELTAYENITLPLEFAKMMNSDRKQFIDEIIKFIGMEERIHHRSDELSGGEQQRIGIAAALAHDPEIILCDEPTGELDSTSKAIVMELFKKIIQTYPNKTIVIVTHDPELRKIADRMYYIRDGKISHEFSKEELQDLNDSPGEGYSSGTQSREHGEQLVLTELREIAHSINERIKNIEKRIHPV